MQKTAETIEMPFGMTIRVGTRNHVLEGVKIPHGKKHFWGGVSPTKMHGSCQLSND